VRRILNVACHTEQVTEPDRVPASQTPDMTYRGFRGWAICQGVWFLVFVPMLSGLLIYEGFVGAPNVLGGLFGILLLIALAMMLPRIIRGGDVSFRPESLTIRTAWSKTRDVRYDEIRRVDQFVNGLPVLTPTCPSLIRTRGRPLLLNDFRAIGLTRARAARSPKVNTAILRLNEELEARHSSASHAQ
jgi:hypothetical protein